MGGYIFGEGNLSAIDLKKLHNSNFTNSLFCAGYRTRKFPTCSCFYRFFPKRTLLTTKVPRRERQSARARAARYSVVALLPLFVRTGQHTKLLVSHISSRHPRTSILRSAPFPLPAFARTPTLPLSCVFFYRHQHPIFTPVLFTSLEGTLSERTRLILSRPREWRQRCRHRTERGRSRPWPDGRSRCPREERGKASRLELKRSVSCWRWVVGSFFLSRLESRKHFVVCWGHGLCPGEIL